VAAVINFAPKRDERVTRQRTRSPVGDAATETEILPSGRGTCAPARRQSLDRASAGAAKLKANGRKDVRHAPDLGRSADYRL